MDKKEKTFKKDVYFGPFFPASLILFSFPTTTFNKTFFINKIYSKSYDLNKLLNAISVTINNNDERIIIIFVWQVVYYLKEIIIIIMSCRRHGYP